MSCFKVSAGVVGLITFILLYFGIVTVKNFRYIEPSFSASNVDLVPVMAKDYELQGILPILISMENNLKGLDLENDREYALKLQSLGSRIMKKLTPWMIAEPKYSLNVSHNPSPWAKRLNCRDPRYQGLFNGSRLDEPRVIVDFVPFGYDLDKLELRLLENYESVDAFVIFESENTQTGLVMPAMHTFSESKRTPLYFYRTKETSFIQIGAKYLSI